MDRSGVHLYCGIPASGKTTLALERCAKHVDETGWPLIIIDSEGTIDVQGVARARTVQEAITLAYKDGQHARLVPESEIDVDRVCWAMRAGKNAILLIDEIGYWCSAHKTPEGMERLLRGHRHANVIIHATTQYPGDLAPVIHQCLSELYAFRTHNTRALEKLSDDYNLNSDELIRLAQGEHCIWRREFT